MDPNYLHEFNPNRHGYCKSIISGRHCGLGDIADVHVRYEQNRVRAPFENFEVAISDEYTYQLEVTLVGVRHPTEEMRKFVEDAIREKLESL